MVTTIKTWTATLNNNLGSDTVQLTQYQTAMYNLKVQLVTAGWTVVWSADGSTAGTSDLWTSAGAIMVNTSASGPRSMIILSAPAGWGLPSSGSYHLFLDCHVNNATTPQTFGFIFHAGTITSPANTSTRATAPTGSVDQAGGTIGAGAYLLNWSSPLAGRAHYWRTSSGDAFVFTRLTSDSTCTAGFAVIDPIYARGNNRAIIVSNTSALTNFYSMTWRGTAADVSSVNTLTTQTVATLTSGWTTGMDAAGEEGFFPIFVASNFSGQRARYYGYIPDVWGFSAGSATLFNYTDTGDAGPTVLRGFSGIGLPVPVGTGALE